MTKPLLGGISMSEKKDAQGHQVEASIGRPAEFGTVVPEGYTMVFVQGFTDLMEALERADRKGYMPHSMQEQWDAFACITAMTAPDSSDSVPPLATGSTEASIRAQAMEDCAVICEKDAQNPEQFRCASTDCAAAIRAAKEQ